MALLPILTYPDPRLRSKSSSVETVNAEIKRLLDDMAETMYDAPGVGLAASQVGVNVRAIVVDIAAQEEDSPGLIKLINPEIVFSEGQQIGEEGCLSIPGFVSLVKRKERVTVKGLNEEGEQAEIDASGLLARVLQHEIDHIDGILFIDRLSRLKRELFKKRIDKAFGRSETYAAF
jgi:peptide deformylase